MWNAANENGVRRQEAARERAEVVVFINSRVRKDISVQLSSSAPPRPPLWSNFLYRYVKCIANIQKNKLKFSVLFRVHFSTFGTLSVEG